MIRDSAPVSSDNEFPLRGRRIVVTRPRSQAHSLVRAIESLGGEALGYPTIDILPPETFAAMDRALLQLGKYHWMIFTSVNGVNGFLERCRQLKLDPAKIGGIRIGAIGPKTAQAVRSASLPVDLVPRKYQAEGILEALEGESLKGKKILLPRSAGARDILPETLRRRGADVDEVEAYRTVPAQWDSSRLRRELEEGKVDMVTFTSSSTVTHFASAFSPSQIKILMSGTAVACIGPVTQRKAKSIGIPVHVVSMEYTIPGLVRVIVDYFKRQNEK